MKIKESQLRTLIRESIEKIILKETFDEKPFYTMDDWRMDGSLKPEVGEYIEDEVIEELAGSVPPTTYSRGIFQPGEAYTMSEDYADLYMTFVRDNDAWKYIGLCPKGSTKTVPEWNGIVSEGVIKEGKRGLNSPKLYQLAKEHGGFNENFYTRLYLNSITDNDVIGIIPEKDLDFLKKSYMVDRINYAKERGFTVNSGDAVEIIPMADWTWVGIIERGGNLNDAEYVKTDICKKLAKRHASKYRDGAKDYVWSDTNKWGSDRKEEFLNRQSANNMSQKK